MDPNACLARFLTATTIRERRLAADAYRDWVVSGGFRATMMVDGARHAVLRLHGRLGADAVVTAPVIAGIEGASR